MIFGAIAAGILLPYGHHFTYLIKYNLVIMLLLAYLNVSFDQGLLRWSHLFVLIANLSLPLLFYFTLLPFGTTYALCAFVMGIVPTAAAAPVLAGFLRTDVSYVTTSVLVTNPIVALVLPFLLPMLVRVEGSIRVAEVLIPVVAVVGIPLILSFVIKRSGPKILGLFRKVYWMSFALFLFNVWIGCSKATNFILFDNKAGLITVLGIMGVIFVVGLINFQIGARLHHEPPSYASGLALGRKNTMFALWIALDFISPLVALGPIFYILFQNGYNSLQIYQVEKKIGLARD